MALPNLNIEPSNLLAPLNSSNFYIWVSNDTSFPCFDDRDVILPFIRSFYPSTASIKCVTSHEGIVAYQIDVPGWLSIPLNIWERREFRPARYKYEKR